ncbi:Ku protein [Rhizobium fabae]|uniref:Ku protein n=1 Tax=Rhizobium fabae TaxID=573179 RepID=A0A7W6B7W7_9HYPH|nr:Ku protein [Rhizobium fabae]
MAGPRANWKGYIKFGEVSFPVALYTAASSSERIAFNTLNRKTVNRVKREFIDSETGDPVEREEQVKGYEVENGQYIVLEPEEVAAAVPESDKTLKIEDFVPCSQIDTTYFDKPYYLTPDKMGTDAFLLLRDGMKKKGRRNCPDRAVPPDAQRAHSRAWQRPDRLDAELRLRGPIRKSVAAEIRASR